MPFLKVSLQMNLSVTLSDLAKSLMMRSIARSLCDSWPSCRVNGWKKTDRLTDGQTDRRTACSA